MSWVSNGFFVVFKYAWILGECISDLAISVGSYICNWFISISNFL